MNHFQLYELVDRTTYQKWGNGAWTLLNPLALEALDGIREFFNKPVVVNNWFGGGPFQYRGYRNEHCPIGAKYSQHKKGNAFDLDVQGMTADEVRAAIVENQDHALLKNIQRMEADVSWVHFDLAKPPEGHERIYLFKA